MADVYRIGVAIAMTSNSAQVLGVLGRDLMDLGRQARALESYLADVRTAAIGALTAINGTFALRSFADAAKHGADILQQQDRMKAAGMSQAEGARATAEAWRETYRVVNRGVTENLAMIQGLREVVGELGPALKLAPTASRFQTALVSITGRSADGQGGDFFRFLQLGGSFINRASGQIDIGEAKRWARIGEAIVAGTHGHGADVTPRDPKRIQLQVGAAGSGPDQIGRMELAHLIGQMKEGGGLMGSRVGAPLYNLIEQLETPSSRQSIAVLERMKPIDSSKVHAHRGGKITSEPGVLKQPSLLETRTSEWVRNILSPARQQLGAKTTQEGVSMTGRLALSSSAAQLIQELLRNPPALKMEYANTRTAFNVDPHDIAKNNPTARIASFAKASKDLLTALGAPMVDDATSLLGKLTAGLNTVALFATKHPKIAADIEMVGAAIAGLAVVGGMVAIISSAASALGPFAAGGAAASGLAFLGGTAVTSLSAAAGRFAPGAAGAAGLLGLAGGLTTSPPFWPGSQGRCPSWGR